MIDTLKLMLKGGIIGIANIIPGVSGGTMAVVLGIYEKLIEAIGNILIDKKRRTEFFLFLVKVSPNIRTTPDFGFSKPTISRNKVVFPEPLFPVRA